MTAPSRALVFRVHAAKRMLQRGIRAADLASLVRSTDDARSSGGLRSDQLSRQTSRRKMRSRPPRGAVLRAYSSRWSCAPARSERKDASRPRG